MNLSSSLSEEFFEKESGGVSGGEEVGRRGGGTETAGPVLTQHTSRRPRPMTVDVNLDCDLIRILLTRES